MHSMADNLGVTDDTSPQYQQYLFVLHRCPKSPWLFTLKVKIAFMVRTCERADGLICGKMMHESFVSDTALADRMNVVCCFFTKYLKDFVTAKDLTFKD